MIGVVGPEDAAARLAEAIGDEGVRSGAVAEVLSADPDVVVAVGERALCDLAGAGARAPVLVVDGGVGAESVDPGRVPALLDRGLDAGFERREHPVLAVEVDGEAVTRGVFDATLVTSEPSRISEFAVETPGAIDRFRADGVVVATPAGSQGYVRALGGPVLDAGARSLVVVPVAAFAIRPTVRVVGADAAVSVRVERDEGDVSLFVDGAERRRVPPGRTVTVEVAGALETLVPASA